MVEAIAQYDAAPGDAAPTTPRSCGRRRAKREARVKLRQGAPSRLRFGLRRALRDRFIEKLLHLAGSLLCQFALLAA